MSTGLNASTIAGIIETLLGREVTVKNGPAGKGPNALIAVYASPDKPVAACVGCSIQFASYAAAALSLVPREVAEGDIRAGKLSDVLDENFREVMNVFGGILSSPGHRVVLDRITGSGEAPDEISKMLSESSPVSFEVEVEGYGKGLISLAA
ncbi:MAG TPA: hypothetical protein VFD92_02300 [Candidatus Binatia bacterium]|nr:hypothetical protein [Candidatus Binatia bacterium]